MFFENLVILFWSKKLFTLPFVAIRVVTCPSPLVPARDLNGEVSSPAKLILGELGRAVKLGNIPWSSLGHLSGNLLSAGLLKSADNLQHGGSRACSKIIDFAFDVVRTHDLLQRSDVSVSQVDDMDVVPDSRAVPCLVVRSKDAQLFSPSHCNLLHVRHQVVGYAFRVLSNQSGRVSSHWIEVTKKNDSPLGIAFTQISQNFFDEKLRSPVRVCSRQGEVLQNWDFFRVAIHRC
mmetsp:Transcript_9688/g.18223  ORF Transcript_9688/g.18223 Transcript_9688/m.18223 type:complete len:234 (-) Transcript_9688:425-1126(-)